MSVYYKYTPDDSKLVVLIYVDNCVYWYASEELVKWFVDTIGKRFHVDLLRYGHGLIYIRVSQPKDHSISAYQYRYDTSVI